MTTASVCEHYFQHFLQSFVGKSLLKDVEGLSASLEVRIKDLDSAPWCLRIEEGRLVEVSQGGNLPVCAFTLDSQTLLEIVRAQCAPEAAFFDFRVEIEGDVETALKLSTVLMPFFENFPYPE